MKSTHICIIWPIQKPPKALRSVSLLLNDQEITSVCDSSFSQNYKPSRNGDGVMASIKHAGCSSKTIYHSREKVNQFSKYHINKDVAINEMTDIKLCLIEDKEGI